MRVMVVGAGRTGAAVLRQLHKNPDLDIITVDPREDPPAVQEGLLEAVDIREALTPLTLDFVLEKGQPDLVLLTISTEDMGLGSAPGLDVFADALRTELAALAKVPLIEVSRAPG